MMPLLAATRVGLGPAQSSMREAPLEKWMCDAKIFQIFEGANQIQRMVIARNIQERYFN